MAPSTRTFLPSAMRAVVVPPQPTTAGIPNSRERSRRVQHAPAVGDDGSEQRERDAERVSGRLGDEDVAALDPIEVIGPAEDARK